MIIVSVRSVLSGWSGEGLCGMRTEVREGIPLRDYRFGRQWGVDRESVTSRSLPARLASPTGGHLKDAPSGVLVSCEYRSEYASY